jgi:hypothetical protein
MEAVMASTPTFDPNPYANFDPSQWSNPYSNFQNSAIPFPSSYAGWPTDASGNPIQPTPGMTLNSSPAAAPAAPAAAQSQSPAAALYSMMSQPSVMNPSGNAALGMSNWGGFLPPGSYAGDPSQYAQQAAAPAAAAPAAAQAAPTSTPLQVGNPLTSQQYLQLRANPGHVTTQGATVPEAASPTSLGSGTLQQFLANWKPATSGPGSGFQQSFAKALKGS